MKKIVFAIPFITIESITTGRYKNLINCLKSIEKLNDNSFSVIITDVLGNVDYSIIENLPIKKVKLKEKYFNRCVFCNILADEALENDILFFLDADIIVPENFCKTIRNYVYDNSCFFPVVYSLDKDGNSGEWIEKGYGILGILKKDFDKIGRYNEKQGRSWGGDKDSYYRCKNHGLDIHRHKVEGLIHQWHPTNFEYKQAFHVEKYSP